MRHLFPAFPYSVPATILCLLVAPGAHAGRSADGLMALYNFCESGGPLVRDVSPGGAGGTLRIMDLRRVERRNGELRIFSEAVISPVDKGRRKLTRTLKASNSLSLEAWITPGSLSQKGPARILSFSGNSSERNFTLGQDGPAIDVRLRTTETSGNGIPSLSTKDEVLEGGETHVVYTRDRQGQAVIYINGTVAAEGRVGGVLDNWDDGFGLHIANESGGGRPWTGSLNLLAIYSRALSSEEVSRHFEAGPAAADSVDSAVAERSGEELFFENRVAPILANHCLECHDSATREGDLDLSRRDPAFAGGKGGKVIIPGRSGESELWLTVHHDEMPDDRDPLSADQKAVLAKWIDDGARWSLDFIDPVLYLSHVGVSDHHVRRLTVEEYIRSVQSAVGVDITDMARQLLPADLRADGFRNTAYNLTVDLKHIHAYSELASEIVRRMDVRDFARRFSSRLKFTDNDMGALITAMGKWIHRAPLEEHELFAYRGITTSVAASGGTYGEAVSLVIEAMLQSPRFLYRIENQIGDGTAWPVDGFEMASRISYTLWGSPPDADLLAAAEKGDLYDRQSISGHVNRMLDDPRAIRQSLEFFRQWLNLDRLNSLNPSADHFPDWDPSLAQDMEKETLMFIEDLLWKQQRPIHQIFDGDFTWLTPRLARHYRLEASLVPDGPGQEFQKVIFPEGHPRGGLLTHGSVLTVGGDEASMVSRGLFVMNQLLRGVVKDPPPCVDTTPVPSKPGMSQRTVALERLSDGSCAGCHKKFEPLAFGLEKFDGLGSYHQMDEFGNALRDDGQILVPGAAEPVEYESSNELMGFLASSSRVEETMVWKLTQFALGRPLAYRDAPAVNAIIEKRPQHGWTWKELVRTILLSDLMKTSMTETLENE